MGSHLRSDFLQVLPWQRAGTVQTETGQTPRSAKMPPLPSQTLRAARGDRPQGQQGPDPRAGAGSQNDSIFGRKLEEVFQLSNTLTSEEPPWPH